jgi:hypothetical protein
MEGFQEHQEVGNYKESKWRSAYIIFMLILDGLLC